MNTNQILFLFGGFIFLTTNCSFVIYKSRGEAAAVEKDDTSVTSDDSGNDSDDDTEFKDSYETADDMDATDSNYNGADKFEADFKNSFEIADGIDATHINCNGTNIFVNDEDNCEFTNTGEFKEIKKPKYFAHSVENFADIDWNYFNTLRVACNITTASDATTSSRSVPPPAAFQCIPSIPNEKEAAKVEA